VLSGARNRIDRRCTWVLQAALRAKSSGSTRFCMGAAWRGPSQVGARQWQRVLDMVKRIRGLDMEVPSMPDDTVTALAVC
jgi:biotin synthase-like enzyme